jgi:hypothetical protein
VAKEKRRDEAWKQFNQWLRFFEHPHIIANLRLKINFQDDIDRACQKLHINSTKQEDRDFLLGILTSILFPRPPRRSDLAVPPRKKKWNAERIARLNDHVAQIRGASQRTELPVDSRIIAECLQHFWPNWWGKLGDGTGTETLKRKIRMYVRI